jgi:hypothetical protein
MLLMMMVAVMMIMMMMMMMMIMMMMMMLLMTMLRLWPSCCNIPKTTSQGAIICFFVFFDLAQSWQILLAARATLPDIRAIERECWG